MRPVETRAAPRRPPSLGSGVRAIGVALRAIATGLRALRSTLGPDGRDRLRVLGRSYPRQYWLMVTGMLISNAGGSLVWPYLLIFASRRLELPLAAVGSLITIQAVAGMLASFVAGTLADRLGRKVVMTVSLAANGLIYLLLVGAEGYLQFAVLLALFGMSNPLYQVGADAMLADMVPSEQRTQAYAINRIASNTGFALGPAIGGFLAATSYSLAFYGASTGFIAYALLVAIRFRETLPTRRTSRAPAPAPPRSIAPDAATPDAPALPIGAEQDVPQVTAAASVASPSATHRSATAASAAPPPAAGRRGYATVAHDRRFVAFTGLLSLGLIAPTSVWILLAVYTKTNFGMPEYLYGWIPTVNAVMCVVVQYPVSMITRRFPSLPVLAVGMTIYAVGAGSVAAMTSFPGFILSMVVLTFGELVVVPVASKHVADLAPSDLRGRYMSVYWLAWAASRGAAPLVGGFLNDRVAPIAIWYGAFAIGLTSALGLAALALRSRRVAAEPMVAAPAG